MNGAGPGRDGLLTIPNLLTLVRLILIPFFVHASVQGNFTAAFVLFVSAGLTDVIDGYIARRFNQRSKIGAFLDPAADKMMMVAAYVVYTLPWVAHQPLPQWLTFTVFIRDVLIVLFAYLLYTRVHITRFPPSIPGKISTLLQVITLAAIIAANTPYGSLVGPLLEPLYRVTLLATLYSGFDYIRIHDRNLERVDSTQ
ncbi:MAG TPA: CDP-alcohol phosphatidyltransferase family protein [Thermoanaerobaculia bacterium]|nr:CDP-alcohol phosphatidyltransferase family protein [Thermoanaerobaculia bacterium]